MEDRATQDVRLVRSALEGGHDAFAELVRLHQKLVFGIAWRYGVRRADIEDLVSEIFFKVYRNLHRYQPDHAFSTWLYRLAVNHVLDHGRRTRREAPTVELPDQLADDSPAAEDHLEQDERATLVRNALASVPSHYREPLFLVYVEGLRLDAVAATLSLPEGTVKSRLLRGRRALREILVRRHPDYFGEG